MLLRCSRDSTTKSPSNSGSLPMSSSSALESWLDSVSMSMLVFLEWLNCWPEQISLRASRNHVLNAGQLPGGQDGADLEQDLDFAFHLRHAQQIRRGDRAAKVGRILDVGRHQCQYL